MHGLSEVSEVVLYLTVRDPTDSFDREILVDVGSCEGTQAQCLALYPPSPETGFQMTNGSLRAVL